MSETQTIDAVVALACPEGGWAYGPGQSPHLDPTCLALLSLAPRREQHAALFAQALAFLDQCALGDGTYRLTHGRHEAAWPTALVLFTLAELGTPREKLEPI